MPSFISKDGVWNATKEKVGLVNQSKEPFEYPKGSGIMIQPGEPFIYEGPDRAAMLELFKAKQETFGIDFHNDPDLINRVRQLGYKSVDAYAKVVGYDAKKVQEEFDKKASKVLKHELPERVKAIEVLGGGIDTAGMGADAYGGFGEPKS